MNLKTGFIAICVVAFSPAVLAQQEVFNGFISESNTVLIAENRGGTSNEIRGPKFQSTTLEDKGMTDAYENKEMEQDMKEMVDDSNNYNRERVHNKRV
ncbi:hypothetical protein VIN01S_23930 [Vibrio inusitatus NBRC 102082]|uniref:Uncharacterized protein n=1 Tax=Vibrio inusitatus NBRC 102082 TaxID=1219070 RepID=A0A4Y3HWN3_9VIBR|nr:hypothetical protein [Vibrio inusitatus]GEA51589.1 hypothetical protein VIN01S_23930 [Vibrio inusitatus NBRC 102082]